MTQAKFVGSFSNAIKGILSGISGERNIKIQLLIGLLVIIASLLLKISVIHLIIILFVVFLVIILELINTSFERLIDLVHPDYHKGFGEIKDIMAGVVLLSSILSVIVGFLILYNPLVNVFKGNPFLIFVIINSFFILGIIVSVFYIIKRLLYGEFFNKK